MINYKTVWWPGCLSVLLVACGGGGGNGEAPPSAPVPISQPGPQPQPLPPPLPGWRGYFVGTARVGGISHFADALITEQGELRLYVGAPDVMSGVLQLPRPTSSAQFVGLASLGTDRGTATGTVIGQACAAPDVTRFCTDPAIGEMTLQRVPGEIEGSLRVVSSQPDETWTLRLQPWSHYYQLPAGSVSTAGSYLEYVAEFVHDTDTVVTIDGQARMQFQSPSSGCTGNGALAAHGNGQRAVFDVTLILASCRADHAYLNGEYTGLATFAPTNYWGYDMTLRIWLSRPGGDAAFMMWVAEPACQGCWDY
jgi:hypothetical protein